jgi:glycerol-3-phosphate dehydrogenase
MVHAGLRYMAGDPQLVQEASIERQRLFRACPHLARPLPYLLPAYDDTPEYDAPALPGILRRYDELAGAWLTAPAGIDDPAAVLGRMPALRQAPRRVGRYWDGVMDDARVTLEVVAAAAESGAAVLNHAPVVSFLFDHEGRIRGARFRDEAPGETPREHEVTADAVVSAAGPYTDLVRAMAGDLPGPPALRPSKGIHVVFRDTVTRGEAVVVPLGGNVLYFLVPFRRGYVAMGCTDTDYTVRGYADLDTVATTEEEIGATVPLLARVFPGAFRAADIVSCYAGVRPLVRPPGGAAKAESDTSRAHRTWRTARGLWVVAGGKFTTFRLMAEQLVDAVVADLRSRGAAGAARPCSTSDRRCHGAPAGLADAADFEEWRSEASARLRRATGLPQDCSLHLCEAYGTAAEEVGSLAAGDPALRERIGDGRPFIMAEVDHAVRREMCLDAADFLARRTQLRFLETQGLDVAVKVVERIGALRGWDAETRQRQVERYTSHIGAVSPRSLGGRHGAPAES